MVPDLSFRSHGGAFAGAGEPELLPLPGLAVSGPVGTRLQLLFAAAPRPLPAAATAPGALSPAAAELERFALSLRGPLFPDASPPTQFAGGSAGQVRHIEKRKLKQEVAELAMKMRQLSLEKDESRHKKRIEMNWIRRSGNMVEISFQCSCGRSQKMAAKIE